MTSGTVSGFISLKIGVGLFNPLPITHFSKDQDCGVVKEVVVMLLWPI